MLFSISDFSSSVLAVWLLNTNVGNFGISLAN